MDGGKRALEAADIETDQPGTPGSKEREQAAKILRSFLETFISEEFLPEVYVNFRWEPPTKFYPFYLLPPAFFKCLHTILLSIAQCCSAECQSN